MNSSYYVFHFIDKPEITAFEAHPSTSLSPGYSLQIVCTVDANPISRITMYVNNRTVFTTEARRSVAYDLSSVTLEDDGAMLSCGAQNTVGSVMRSITLSVTGKLNSKIIATIRCLVYLWNVIYWPMYRFHHWIFYKYRELA